MQSVDSEASTIEQLENRLSQVRTDIKNVEDDIKTATVSILRNHFRKRKLQPYLLNDKDFGPSTSNRHIEPGNLKSKPRVASIITTVKHRSVEPPADEEGGDSDDDNKSPDVNTNDSKEDTITYHKKPELSESELKRGSRMFGLMMKTFNDFKKDSEKSTEEMKKRDEILEKVAEQEKQADALAKEERNKLLRLRSMKQRELINLRKAIRYKELEEISKQEFAIQSKFIKTKTSPPLFYCPYSMNESTKAAQAESNEELKKILDDKIAHFHLSISVIESNSQCKSASNDLDKSIENDNNLLVHDSYAEDDMLGLDNDD